MTYDAIVLGGGIVGVSTAYALAKRGHNILMIEQYEAGHKRGSSHGDGRVIRFNYMEGIYVEMAMQAYPAWRDLEQASGIKLIQETGLIEYGPMDCIPMQESEAQLQKYNLPYEKMSPVEANQRFPQFKFADNTALLYQPEGAIVFADTAVKALWQVAKTEDASILTGCRIEAIEASDNDVTLRDTEGNTYTASKLVVAVGGWTKTVADILGINIALEVTQEVLSYFAPKDDSVNHRVGTMPAMVDYYNLETPFYCLPIVEVGGVKVGWHHTGRVVDADDERLIDAHIVKGAGDWVSDLFPHLNPEAIHSVACLYSNTPDYHFVLDTHPTLKHIAIGTGFSGHGFKFGSILGDILADLVLGEQSSLDLSTFSLSRFDDLDKLEKRIGA